MTWLENNYEKVVMGVAALAAVGVGYSIVSGDPSVRAPKPANPINDTQIAEREQIPVVNGKYAGNYEIKPISFKDIEVRSFVSYPLYSVKGTPGIQALTDDYEIHPGMKLEWWKKYGLDDYKLKGAPEMDSDGDGFTNEEEFDASTDPTNDKEFPNLIAKLLAKDSKSIPYRLSWNDDGTGKGNFTFQYNKRRGGFDLSLGVGDSFPVNPRKFVEEHKNRFEIKAEGQDPDVSGQNGKFYLIQDNGKYKGKKQFKLFWSKRLPSKDNSVTFALDIPGKNEAFVVPEGASFSLPYSSDAKVKPYTFKSYDAETKKAEIEYGSGDTKSIIKLDVSKPK